MEFNKVVNDRHSIREYDSKKVPNKIIKKLITDASKAPSAKNEQNWMFYVIQDEKSRKIVIDILNRRLVEKDFNKINPDIKKLAIEFYKNLGNAPCIIFAYKNNTKNPPIYQYFNDIAGVSCAIENLMLSASDKGLGTCWLGTFKDDENAISKLIGAKNKELMAAIVLGYPKRGYKPLIREKKKLKEILKFV